MRYTRGKRPLEEFPQATQSVAPNPFYSQPLQGVANLAPPRSQSLSAATPADARSSPQGIEIESEDPFCTPIPNTPPGTLTAALDYGVVARETARITREKTIKKSVDGFEKLLLSAIEDLTASRSISIGAKSSGTQYIPRPFHKSQPSKQTAINTYAEILKKDATFAKRPNQGEHNRPRNIATDRRVLIRLDKNNSMRDHKPNAYATSSGVALVARDESKIKVLVQPVPKNVQSILGNGLQVDNNALIEETERITGSESSEVFRLSYDVEIAPKRLTASSALAQNMLKIVRPYLPHMSALQDASIAEDLIKQTTQSVLRDQLDKKQQAFPEADPFRTFGAWFPDHADKLEVVLPDEAQMAETTNELTRTNQPKTRYWRAPIEFKSSKYGSATIRLNSIRVPYVAGRLYGESYVYMGLPDAIRAKILEAAVGK
ncbi:hypothetical protein EPUL_000256, partial [Erysiphe pulchra]